MDDAGSWLRARLGREVGETLIWAQLNQILLRLHESAGKPFSVSASLSKGKMKEDLISTFLPVMVTSSFLFLVLTFGDD